MALSQFKSLIRKSILKTTQLEELVILRHSFPKGLVLLHKKLDN